MKAHSDTLVRLRLMLLGWGILAVPTGIVTAEMAAHRRMEQAGAHAVTTRTCHECLAEGQPVYANFCFRCGAELPAYQRDAAGVSQ